MSAVFPEPSAETADPAMLFIRYLEFYRSTVVAKTATLAPQEQRVSRLPSGWTPLELVHHLAFMERRWFVWGFLGEPVDEPWGDSRDDRWHLPDGRTADDVVGLLREVGERTTRILTTTPLDARGARGGRFDHDPPSLAWICFHVLQEYARHAGHLDVAVELAGGPTGE